MYTSAMSHSIPCSLTVEPSNLDTLGTISGVVMYTNRVFGTAKCVLFVEVSSFQGVLSKGFHSIYIEDINVYATHILL